MDIEFCSKCHGEEMHYVSKSTSTDSNSPEQAGVAPLMEDVLLQNEPTPVSPVGFATLAGLIGMAFGMVLAPWLERWFRRMNPS